ncbi:hypothetical protein AX16_008579 [Volvariella volvacea WC 439]|nr:hypothetical protein AX16_008579 [Volvariella volvacea WC 439]
MDDVLCYFGTRHDDIVSSNAAERRKEDVRTLQRLREDIPLVNEARILSANGGGDQHTKHSGRALRDQKGQPQIECYHDTDSADERSEFRLEVLKQEIEHRSKGDLMAMVIAFGQTWWFVIQCAARYIAGLDLTVLELTAFAFAIPNMVTWFLWIHKPHHVRLPIYLDPCGGRIPGPDFDRIRELNKQPSAAQQYLKGDISSSASSIRAHGLGDHRQDKATHAHGNQESQDEKHFHDHAHGKVISYLIHPLLDSMGLHHQCIVKRRVMVSTKESPNGFCVENVATYHTTWFKASADTQSPPETIRGNSKEAGEHRARTSPAGRTRTFLGIIVSTIVALFFGGIHCIGWASTFEFPTHQERL